MKLREYLDRENVSAAAFARRIGRATATVMRIANGETVPEPETLAKIVAATDGAVQPDDLVPPSDGSGGADVAEEEMFRARVYRLLGRFLARPPDSELLSITASLEGDAGDFGLAVSALAVAARRATPETAADEFQTLFIGVGRGELVPYASYYIAGFLNEKPLARLRGDLARLGIARADHVKEPEDGMAALCEVMAGLIDGSFGAPAGIGTQRAFFDAHLAPWAGRFFEDLQAASGARLYAAVGELGRRFVPIEETAFAMADE